MSVTIGTRCYSQATGKSKKEAKHHAAALAWEIIEQEMQADQASRLAQQPLPSPSPPVLPPSQSPEPAGNSPEASSSHSLNYISLLNDYQLKNKVVVQYMLTSKKGLDHKPIFSQVCKIDDKVFGEGTGNSIQIAKQNAAKQAWEKLNIQPASKTERSATPTNSSACEETSYEASKKSAQEASDKSDSIVFRNTGTCSNGNDLDSECKSAGDRLANQISSICISETSPSSLASPKGHAMKPKRLAPNFSTPPLQKESKYTKNNRFLEDFEDIKRIGCGAYGNVFKAKHAVDKTLYAVKRVIIDEESKPEKEVQALIKLEHENIVRYYYCWCGKDIVPAEDSISDNSTPGKAYLCLFIQMQYCEKGTLAKWISEESGKESSKNDAVMKFQQIVEGVEYIHKEDFIHRDLKPGNIFISRDKIKIGDFGLVTSGVNDFLTQRTEKTGTKSYRAPEQTGNTYGKQIDIFPLGLILFEMLYPFETEHHRSKEWLNIRNGKLPKAFTEKFPREEALIRKLVFEDPSERPSAVDILRFFRNKPYNPHTC